jgi:aspartyl-tRNA(Asn)/glutamyl-tRNA(Gln) amidotransferase subunit A
MTSRSPQSFDVMAGGRTPYQQRRQALAGGAETCVESVEECLAAFERGRSLNAFLAVFEEDAREQARLVDRKLAHRTAGPLAGMVVAVKDNICVKGKRVTCASKILGEFDSLYDATAIRRLRAADAVLLGKTNLDEFAMGSSTENSAFGRVLHPADPSRIPGGSSGGSAVAVAAGMADTALGSDTGGSIRQPAAFCGIVGLKPTYGRVSRYGLVALASSLDQIGPLSLSVADAASVLQVIAGHDENDSTTAEVPVPDYLSSLTGELNGVVIGVPREALGEGLQPGIARAFRKAMDLAREGGAQIKEIALPHSEYVISTYYILMTAEASSNLARFDGARYGRRSASAGSLDEMYVKSRSEGFGAETKRRIMLGTYVLSAGYYDAYYRKAQQVRRLIQNDFLEVFRTVECILMPTTPTTAFSAGEKTEDPLQMYLSDVFTVSANLAGIPAISIPFGVDEQGLPIGMQVLGRHFDESTILRVAESLERQQR